MKKGQSGVSLIALVITIIVVIILAAIAFGTSTSTITRANFSTFENNMGEVRVAFQAAATTLKGVEAQNGTERTDAQVYNYIAKGASKREDPDVTWLSRNDANTLACTKLEPTHMKSVIGIELPTMKVNTPKGTGREVSYFVTKTGDIFIWPPYEFDGKYYVNETITVDATAASSSFSVNGVGITVALPSSLPTASDTARKDLDGATVYFEDSSSAAAPLGRESSALIKTTVAAAS